MHCVKSVKSSSAAVLVASTDRLGPHGSVQVSTLIKSSHHQLQYMMMTCLELKLAQSHVALIGPKKQQVLKLMMTSKKCPYSKLLWSVFSRIRTEHGEIQSVFPYSVRIRENTDQNNSEYGHFSCSDVI